MIESGGGGEGDAGEFAAEVGENRVLAEVVDYEDHAGAEGGYVAVVVFQGGDGGVVGSGDGVESFSGFDAVVNDAGSRARGRGGFGAGGRLQSGVVFGV